MFQAITTPQIETGEPTAQELFQKIKDNFDDHESRLGTVEGAVNSYPPIRFSVTEYWYLLAIYGTIYEVDVERIPFDLVILGVRLLVIDAGSSGTLEVNLEYKRGAGSWTNLLSVNPSVPYTDGNYALSTNAVVAVPELLLGDLVRLNIVTGQTGNSRFILLLEYERQNGS
jgi:hypothetical protein